MGKRKSSINMKGFSATTENSRSYLQQQASMSLRQESSGKIQSNVKAKSMFKLDHLKDLAVWASGEPSLFSLSAFFGQRLAATAEALGVSPDPSFFFCQRCESILQPGYNCTVRIENNKAKIRSRRKKSKLTTQNNVVYKCHVCSHRNLKRGTPTWYMQDIIPSKNEKKVLPKRKFLSRTDPTNSSIHRSSKLEDFRRSKDNMINTVVTPLPEKASDDPLIASPSTPRTSTSATLLDLKRRKRNRSRSKKAVEIGSSSNVTDAEKSIKGSSKRKRKSWTSLKEIAEHSVDPNIRNFPNLSIPFIM